MKRTRPLRWITTFFAGLLLSFYPCSGSSAQPAPTQTIRGTVVDADLRMPLPGANVIVVGSHPVLGTVTHRDGSFVLTGVPLGRQPLQFTYVGYEPVLLPDVIVASGREVVLTVGLREQVLQGQEAVITGYNDAFTPANDMAVVSARPFSVEETRRYAGGLDDPARLASAFAGVTSTGGVQQNALVIRGNSPKGVQWRLEGVEIPNPNHFGGLSVVGGGGLTLFSSQLLDNAGFYTGAFPAEYGNALSGVFDMNFRTGHPSRREYALQAGINGLEIASEGPFVRGKPSTYLFNYRYSTLALLMPLLPTDAGASYQDLSFKLAFPTRRLGRFEVWGLGGLDEQRMKENRDRDTWESEFWDRTRFDLDLGIGAAGVTHSLLISPKAFLRTVAAVTANNTAWHQERLDDGLALQPDLDIESRTGRGVLSTQLNYKPGARHLNRSGIVVNRLFYDLSIAAAPDNQPPVIPVAEGKGQATLLQVYSMHRVAITPSLSINAGMHTTYFSLTRRHALEPRVGIHWQAGSQDAFSFGYGLHSQIEELRFYLVRNEDPAGPASPNRDLDFSKAHHLVVGYEHGFGDAIRMKVEGYLQQLYDVPVIPDSSYSLLNLEQDWTFAEALVNTGAGRNYGVEVTAERRLKAGYYYLLTGSVFRSRYRGGDGLWRNTRFDQGYAGNLLLGKEFRIGSRGNLFGLNGRLIFVGGRRRSPIDPVASALRQEVVLDEGRAFTEREAGQFLADLTLTHRLNRRRYSEVWALQVKNALGAKDIVLDYNYRTARVEEVREGFPLPMLSYRIEF